MAQWKEKLGAEGFLFVSDPLAWTCSQYGVAKQLVVHNEWVNVPAAFVLDAEGVVRYQHVGKGFSDRATADELLWAVGALGR